MSNLKKALNIVSHFKSFRTLVSFYSQGYLYEEGWFHSLERQSPVRNNGDPIPWVTYSFIDFIQQRLTKDIRMLEFGSGNSTLFYAARVGKLYSVEHDLGWYEKTKSIIPQDVTLAHIPLAYGDSYSKYATNINEPLDIIIVDGRDRVNCAKESVGALSETGVLVLDDAERAEYAEAISFLQECGFRKIDFWGVAPGVFNKKSTCVFYRAKNCLNI